MRLLNFQYGSEATALFGVVIKEYAVSFETLMRKTGQKHEKLVNIYSYLESLPSSEDEARDLLRYGETCISSLSDTEKIPLYGFVLQKERFVPRENTAPTACSRQMSGERNPLA